MSVKIHEFSPDYGDYLRDESRMAGKAESISFPASESEIVDVVRETGNLPVTVQGGRTGITAGAVPFEGHVLNLSRMNRIVGLRENNHKFYIAVQPGLLLSELRETLETLKFNTGRWSDDSLAALEILRSSPKLFFPTDPTETSASIGGMVACNASGARSYQYGPIRQYVHRLRVILSNGQLALMERGKQVAEGFQFTLELESNETVEGDLPQYSLPSVKSAAGYYVEENMDLLDLFIGSEGTLGIISEIELELVAEPASIWGVMAFFPSEQQAIDFVINIRGDKTATTDIELSLDPVAVEFFNHNALDLLRQQRDNPAFAGIPVMPEKFHTAIYLEFHGDDEDTVSEGVMEASEIMIECGGDEGSTWLADDARELQRLKNFRHAVPESVNLLIDGRRKSEPDLTKLGTDMAVPNHCLRQVMEMYNSDLREAQLESVLFGHIGDNHIHVNILPRTMNQYQEGKSLYLQWARQIIDWGGTVSAEHGIGKLKKSFLREQYGEQILDEMKALKRLFDPKDRLSPGNLFP